MGSTSVKININQNLLYQGQVQNNTPHGNGRISIYQKIDGKQYRQTCIIEGLFQKGQLLKCSSMKGDLTYVGQVKSGTFSGLAQITNKKQKIAFKGNVQDGILIKGQILKQNKYACKGQFKIDYQNAKNKLEKSNIYLIDGENAQFNILDRNQKLKGKFEYGELSGLGKYEFSNGDNFFGNFRNGYIEGKGVYSSKNQYIKVLQGYFSKSKPNSCSKIKQNHKIQFSNGDIYEGPMKQGCMHGAQGNYKFADGTVYKGAFYQNSLTGDCQISYGNSSQLQSYKGQVSDGLFNGLGVVEYKNGVILKGYFLNNCKNGPCLYIYGQRMFKCLYIMDQLMGEFSEVSINKE